MSGKDCRHVLCTFCMLGVLKSDIPTDMDSAQSKRLAIRPEWRENRLSFVASVKPTPGTPDSAKATMEQSPLTQDVRPEIFEPKIVGLYKMLFRVWPSHTGLFLFELIGLRMSKTTTRPKGSGESYSFSSPTRHDYAIYSTAPIQNSYYKFRYAFD